MIIVDETSMVALSLMARLIDAVRPDARLILVGDPEQLASVEAGAVLGDIVGPALERPDHARHPRSRAAARRAVTGAGDPARRRHRAARPPPPASATRVVVLRANYRFRGSLADLAAAVRSGDADRAVRLLSAGDDSLRWVEVDDAVDWAGADRLDRAPAGPDHGHRPPAPPCSQAPQPATATRPSTRWPASGSCVPTVTARPG